MVQITNPRIKISNNGGHPIEIDVDIAFINIYETHSSSGQSLYKGQIPIEDWDKLSGFITNYIRQVKENHEQNKW
jgi:hypothetical protein